MRIGYALVLGDHDNAHVPAGDRFFFVEGARLLAGGHGFVHPFVWEIAHVGAPSAAHPPLWMMVLAPLAKLGALDLDAARLAGAVVGAAGVAATGAVAARMAGDRAGLLAAGLAAVYPAWVIGDTSGMSEVLYGFLVAAAVLALLGVRDRPRLALALGAGVVVGLAGLARTEGLLLVPFAVWPVLWRRWALLAAATLAVALTIAPWTVRNAVELHRLVPVSTNTETVVAGANCEEAWHGRETGGWSPGCLVRASGALDLADYDEGVLAARWRRAGFDYARDHAGRASVVAAVRVLRTWRLWQPLREGELSEGENRGAAKVAALVFLLLLLPAGLLGARRAPLRRDHRLLLVALAAMVTLTSAVGWGAPRFLRPAELALIVGAAAWAGHGRFRAE